MRIWDINPKYLCRKHLLGEHLELHAIWSIIVNKKKGYSSHPETKRWVGKLKALYIRHEDLVDQFKIRGYKHNSELDKNLATGSENQNKMIDSIDKQFSILSFKNCDCKKIFEIYKIYNEIYS